MTLNKTIRNIAVAGTIAASALNPAMGSGFNESGNSNEALNSLGVPISQVYEEFENQLKEQFPIKVDVRKGEPAENILRRDSRVSSLLNDQFKNMREYLIQNGCPAYLEDKDGKFVEFFLNQGDLRHKNSYNYNLNIDPQTQKEIGCGSLVKPITTDVSSSSPLTHVDLTKKDSFSIIDESSFSLPLRVGKNNLPTLYSLNDGLARDVTDFSAENNWEASFSKYGVAKRTTEDLTTQILNSNLTSTANFSLSARLFASAFANRNNIGDITNLFEETDFNKIISEDSCLKQTQCNTLTQDEVLKGAFIEGVYSAAKEHLVENANNGNYSLSSLQNLTSEDNVSKFLNYAGWILPVNSARGYQTGYTQLVQNPDFKTQAESSLEYCLTQDFQPKEMVECGFDSGYKLTTNTLGGQK